MYPWLLPNCRLICNCIFKVRFPVSYISPIRTPVLFPTGTYSYLLVQALFSCLNFQFEYEFDR